MKKRCPYCGVLMVKDSHMNARYRPTYDHILPKELIKKTYGGNSIWRDLVSNDRWIEINGTTFLDKRIINTKQVCRRCNNVRSEFDHCVAAMILHRLIKGDIRFYTINKGG